MDSLANMVLREKRATYGLRTLGGMWGGGGVGNGGGRGAGEIGAGGK